MSKRAKAAILILLCASTALLVGYFRYSERAEQWLTHYLLFEAPLDKYPYGISRETVVTAIYLDTGRKPSIIHGPKTMDEIAIPGYTRPERDLKENETLVIAPDTQLIYLYFDENKKLVHKEMLSS